MQIDNRVTGKTRLIGVMGNPIEHSISPQLHNTISKHLGIDLVYVPLKVEKSDLENAVKGLKALNFVGFNVTIPYKKEVMKFLDDNTKEALLMGAVNTVKNIDGRFYGYNTDAEGFSRSFKEETGVGFKGKKVLIIGAGGVARAISVKIALEGAKKIFIVNRTLSKAEEISELINNNVVNVAHCLYSEDDSVSSIFEESDVVINTTSAGMHPNEDVLPLEQPIKFSTNQIIYDVIYNPAKTKFLLEAEVSGCKTVNGLGMLFYQGIYAYEIWTGVKIPDEMKKELFKSFKDILQK
ncbi:MAG: shikimate dehydrogenase [Clostridia bacterium]|nr:shikimate dehydrogenase [Clostridia bacterium]